MMTATRFAALAEAHGGDLARWPEAERQAASAFRHAHPDAAGGVLGAEARLDGVLAATPAAEPDPALFEAVLARAPAATAQRTPRWAGIAAGLALMIGAGAGWVAAPAGDPYADPVFAQAFGALEAPSDLDDLAGEAAR